jgi:hypothetical protein
MGTSPKPERRPEVVDREILKLEKELSGQASTKKK